MTTQKEPEYGDANSNMFGLTYPKDMTGTGDMTPEEMINYNIQHAKWYHDGDIDAIVNESLHPDAYYEYYPNRIRYRGKEAIRRNHEIKQKGLAGMIDEGKPKVEYTLFGENCYAAMFSVEIPMEDGTRKRCYKFALIPFKDGKMMGEIVWNDKYFAERLDKLFEEGGMFDLPGCERF